MKIATIGGGPAGLYFSILMKAADASHDITVYERNLPHDTFGWGVVFSDQTLENLKGADTITQTQIIDNLARWDEIDVRFKGQVVTSGGHGFCGIARKRLLNILEERSESLGVKLEFANQITDIEQVGEADLIIAADGVNSRIRSQFAEHFVPDIRPGKNKFVWLGTHKLFEAFNFIFVETEWGWFQAHAYRFDDQTSTFIVETREETWRRAGLQNADTAATIAFCEKIFAEYLDGYALMSNSRHLQGSDWINFSLVSNQRWSKGNLVLMGDAAHTAHFSIGSGTKLALEDAIALAEACAKEKDIPTALASYEAERRIGVLRIQSAAKNSTEWFENVERYARFDPTQFAYTMLTRSQRISHENLRLRDPKYVEMLESHLAERAGSATKAPMFLGFRLRDLSLANRVVVAPVGLYCAENGIPQEMESTHLCARAMGGAGLIFTGMTGVTPEGRLTPGCTGMWNEEQALAWKRITHFIHTRTDAKICVQIGHSGPKGSTKPSWDGANVPLDENNWGLIAASAVPWSEHNQVPRAMIASDMERIRKAFVEAARLAAMADFDMLEIQAGHGNLLSSFISPLTNLREDEYGGSLENRLRFPLQIFDAARAEWPQHLPMSVRISAVDWVHEGTTMDDAVEIARAFAARGADIIDVSSGETSIYSKPVYGRMYQTPFSDRLRNEAGIPTIAVGNITDFDQINSIIAAGRADLCALGRPHLSNPNFTLHAAARLGYREQVWPLPYLDGKRQLEHQAKREKQDARATAI
jgi:anthraniloyl-CoA monooxygenase